MINHTINSERSFEHWTYFDPSNKKVLDLGCGRHDTHNVEDHSPTHFINKQAISVLAVDIRESEVEYFNSLGITNLLAIIKPIQTADDVRVLLQSNDITAIKCDIEGLETVFYEITAEELKNIQEFGLEYHTLDIREGFIQKFNEWGFEIVAEGKFGFVHAPQMGVLYARKK